MKIVHTSGKRKTAIARATIRKGTGRVRINKKPLELVEPEISRAKIQEVLALAGDLADKIDIDVTVTGGGFNGQAEAARTAIGRGLVEYSGDKTLRETLYAYDKTTLKSDARRREPKKYGGPGARAKYQKSYR